MSIIIITIIYCNYILKETIIRFILKNIPGYLHSWFLKIFSNNYCTYGRLKNTKMHVLEVLSLTTVHWQTVCL